MNKLKRKNSNLSVKLIAILFAMSSLQLSAKTPYEFSVYGGGGYSFFLNRPYTTTIQDPMNNKHYSSVEKVSSSGIGGDLGVGFTGFIAPQFGLHVGLGLGFYNVGIKVDTLRTYEKEALTVPSNDRFYLCDLYTTLSNYRETYKTVSLSIPFMLHFQATPNSSSWNRRSSTGQGFYAKAGIKLNILLSNNYELEVAKFHNEAYSPDLENIAATQEFAGLGTFKGKSGKGSFGYVQALFAFEAGMKWDIGDNRYVYTGAYLDYGLNDPSKSNREPMNNFDYTDREKLDMSSLLDFSNKMHLMTIGIKLRMAFIR